MKIIYFSCFHSVMTYGIILGGNSADRDNVFKLQKRIIRIITNSSNRTSCRGLFKKLGILPLQSQYILSLALFVIKNMKIFTPNLDIHKKIPEINLTSMYHRQVWPNIIKVYILLALKFSLTYPKILRNCLVIQINLKENLRNSFYWAHFTLLMNSLAGLL